jgi:hypothetical protein
VPTLCAYDNGNDGCDSCSDGYGFEDIKTVESGADDSSGNLGMPMDFLDILLTLMDKEQLRGDVLFARTPGTISHLVIILFHRKVPERDLVVRTGCREDGILSWVPLDGCDRGSMPIE